MHGQGVYTWKDGRRYEGEYLDDKKHGFGTYFWADGRKYEGNWAFGKQHGKGRYTVADGSSRVGVWENGKRTQWLDEESTISGGTANQNGAAFGGYHEEGDDGQSHKYTGNFGQN